MFDSEPAQTPWNPATGGTHGGEMTSYGSEMLYIKRGHTEVKGPHTDKRAHKGEVARRDKGVHRDEF